MTTSDHQQSDGGLLPCPLGHYVSAGLRAIKSPPHPQIICLDCGLILGATDWITVYERWNARAHAPVDDERVRRARSFVAETGGVAIDREYAQELVAHLLALLDKKED